VPNRPTKAGNVFVIDEHLKSHTTLAEHTRLIKNRYPQNVEATYVDPAGRQRREITGTSVIAELAALGVPTQYWPSRITDGIELIHNHLSLASGSPRLFIANQCELLIRALQALRYQKLTSDQLSELPEKDGVHDHIVNTLRYFFINHFAKP